MYSRHLYSVWIHFIMHFQWHLIFVFQSVPTPTLRCSVAAGDTAEEFLGHWAVGKPGWGHDRRKSCSQGIFGSEVLLERAVNRVLGELGF